MTLDANCIIDLVEQRPAAASVRKLASSNGLALRLQIPAIAASERLPGGHRRDDFASFKALLDQLALGSAALLRPMGYFGVCFFDWCVSTDAEMVEQEKRLHEILFPKIEFDYVGFCASLGVAPSEGPPHGRWLNAKCDVQALWCHIHEGGGFFVTSDGNFHKATKKSRLEQLGVGRIHNPDEAVAALGL